MDLEADFHARVPVVVCKEKKRCTSFDNMLSKLLVMLSNCEIMNWRHQRMRSSMPQSKNLLEAMSGLGREFFSLPQRNMYYRKKIYELPMCRFTGNCLKMFFFFFF